MNIMCVRIISGLDRCEWVPLLDQLHTLLNGINLWAQDVKVKIIGWSKNKLKA